MRVGPGVVVTFSGSWPGGDEPLLDGNSAPLSIVLTTSLEPGMSVILSVNFNQANNSPGVLPDSVTAIVDGEDGERECIEDNNSITAQVEAGVARPDLAVGLGAAFGNCPSPQVLTTLTNNGTADASNITIRYYAGDPSRGGTALSEEIVAGPIAPGAEYELTASMSSFPTDRDIVIYAVVDPDKLIDECNEGNNRDNASNTFRCGFDIR